MEKIINKIRREPVIVTNTLAILGAWIATVHPDSQFEELEAGIATIILAVVGLYTRSKVTPTE